MCSLTLLLLLLKLSEQTSDTFTALLAAVVSVPSARRMSIFLPSSIEFCLSKQRHRHHRKAAHLPSNAGARLSPNEIYVDRIAHPRLKGPCRMHSLRSGGRVQTSCSEPRFMALFRARSTYMVYGRNINIRFQKIGNLFLFGPVARA